MAFVLKPQEIPLDSPESDNMFDLVNGKRVVATRAVADLLGENISEASQCVQLLHEMAQQYRGLDYLQVFENDEGENLWVIEDDESITVLLPSDY
tara:strand:- start:110 stop:394 length:285 start_codon:yes stop_codon:yes gene_type:complete